MLRNALFDNAKLEVETVLLDAILPRYDDQLWQQEQSQAIHQLITIDAQINRT